MSNKLDDPGSLLTSTSTKKWVAVLVWLVRTVLNAYVKRKEARAIKRAAKRK